jgi:hypothetical protein
MLVQLHKMTGAAPRTAGSEPPHGLSRSLLPLESISRITLATARFAADLILIQPAWPCSNW